jgi:hypothetical protein
MVCPTESVGGLLHGGDGPCDLRAPSVARSGSEDRMGPRSELSDFAVWSALSTAIQRFLAWPSVSRPTQQAKSETMLPW